MRDANQIAQEQERRERAPQAKVVPNGRVVRGTLSVWRDITNAWEGDNPSTQAVHVSIDISRPGVLIAYDERGDAEIYYPEPGWYVNFVPDRDEGE